MKMKIVALLIAMFSILVFSIPSAFAHPGNTASDGCHYCRTNCSSWGVAWNQRHCHGGSSYSYYSYSDPSYSSAPTCPANSYYSSGSCTCNSGYAPSLDYSYCVEIPDNAHAVISTTDVWLCNTGYYEVGNTCEKEEEEKEVVLASDDDTFDDGISSVEASASMSKTYDWSVFMVLGVLGGFGWLISKSKTVPESSNDQ